jgi:hypothetical protein
VILLVLIALVARVDAAPGGDPIDPAIRYADALSGAVHAPSVDDGEDEDDDDGADERAALDDPEDEEELADRGEPADRELAALTGEIAEAEEPLLGDTDEVRAPAGLALDDDDDAADAGSAGPGALAMLDAELAPGDATAALDAADAAATAGADEVYEQWMRHRRPSPWGRLDVGVSWRRRWSEPIHAPANRYDEIWLVATWRR